MDSEPTSTQGSEQPSESGGASLSLDASSPDALRASIRALQRSNPDFANVFGDLVGSNAQRTWAPKVRKLESELEVERNLRKKQELELLASTKKGSEEIDRRFASDPQFAQDFAKLAHYTPPAQTNTVDPEAVREEIAEAFQDLFAWAKNEGLPDDAAKALQTKAASGAYDHPGEELTQWRNAFSRLEREVTATLLKTKGGSSGTSNPALTKGGPDLSAGTKSTTVTRLPKSAEEFNNLPTENQRELYRLYRDEISKLR